MASRKQVQEEQTETDAKVIKQAIAEAQTLIGQGSTKIEASMVVYRALEAYPQDTVVSAMIDGANLTPKGALTYWYNCRRKLAREKAGTVSR